MTSTYDRCPKCREFGWTKTHRCPPKWHVFWVDGDGFQEEPALIQSYSAKDAAEKYIRQLDSDTAYEYGFSSSETTPTLLVISEAEYVKILGDHENKAPHEIPWTEIEGDRFLVEGEFVPRYYARPVAR